MAACVKLKHNTEKCYNPKSFNLDRFSLPQDACYDEVLEELRDGCKRSHWIWYIFPQLKGLGRSWNSEFYGLEGRTEAEAYLNAPVLGSRLREVTKILLDLQNRDACDIFSPIDAVKVRSSMTLFDAISPNDIFKAVLDKYYDGSRDDKTLKRLIAESEEVTPDSIVFDREL